MIKYKTLATVRLHSGSIMLDAEQVERRAGRLKIIKAGLFEIEKSVEFKAGEIIGLDEVAKPYRPLLEEIEPQKRPKAEPKRDDI